MKRKPRKAWLEGRRKCHGEGVCRLCGSMPFQLDPHHIVYRSLAGDNHEDNCLPVCRACHRAIHDKAVDVWDYLTEREKAHAISLLGLVGARNLLIPSRSPKRVAA